jgi:thiosulfate/3-mercaptopyruvate sulfurtransferase
MSTGEDMRTPALLAVIFGGLFVLQVTAADDRALTPAEAIKKVNERVTVQMEVKAAKDRLEKRGEIYLDSEEDFRDPKNLGVVVTRVGAAKLKEAGIDDPAGDFKGKTIRVTGTVILKEKRPRIEVDDARQIEVVGYPRPELLLEPVELARPDVAKPFVVLDARERRKYEGGHVPQARWVDPAAWAKAFDHGQDAAGWGRRIGGLGIGSDTPVVVYDDNHAKDAARVWWLLRYWGVADVRLLNGGWAGWTAAGNPAEKGEAVATAVAFEPRSRPARLATKEQLLKSLDGGALQVVDARSAKEFCGEERLTNKRAGAIPGARNLEWSELIDKETHRFKPAAELRRLFERAGVGLDRPTATYCQSGGRAAVLAFGLELMGARQVSNYYPSWAEWGNAEDTPVVLPKQP